MIVMEEYLTVEEVAQELRVSTDTVLRWIRRKELPAYKFGGIYRITPADYQHYKATRRTTSENKGTPSQES